METYAKIKITFFKTQMKIQKIRNIPSVLLLAKGKCTLYICTFFIQKLYITKCHLEDVEGRINILQTYVQNLWRIHLCFPACVWHRNNQFYKEALAVTLIVHILWLWFQHRYLWKNYGQLVCVYCLSVKIDQLSYLLATLWTHLTPCCLLNRFTSQTELGVGNHLVFQVL